MDYPFSKLHGLGNDFLLIDARDPTVDITPARAQALCDRHRGVGADGVLLFTGNPSHPEMTVLNADGSKAEMCGNGLRCFVKWIADRFKSPDHALTVETGAGPLRCTFERGPSGEVHTVAVAMGRPTLTPEAIPVRADGPLKEAPFELLGRALEVTAVGTGNPHAVVFNPLTEEERRTLGPALGAHRRFTAGVNVEFCRPLPSAPESPSRMQVQVYERGCGWTEACGTGATAAAFAALTLGKLPADRPVQVDLPGGALLIEIADNGEATMSGPAVHVFDGIWRE